MGLHRQFTVHVGSNGLSGEMVNRAELTWGSEGGFVHRNEIGRQPGQRTTKYMPGINHRVHSSPAALLVRWTMTETCLARM
jgi:hypothetical protein